MSPYPKLPPDINDTPLNRWACLRAGVVTSSEHPDHVACVPCSATISECQERACDTAGRCGRRAPSTAKAT